MQRILKAELIGWHRGKKIPRPYRAVLVTPDVTNTLTQPLIKVEEQMSDGYWSYTPGQWYLSTLCDALMKPTPRMGMLSIDFDQDWSVSGMNEAIIESTKFLAEGGEKNGSMAEAENSGRGNSAMG